MRIMILSLPGMVQNEDNLFPLGVGYLLASLKKNHDVQAYHFNDLEQAKRQIIKSIKIFNPEVIGFSCNTFNRGFVKDSIQLVRKIGKNIKIIVGGIHASFCYEQVINYYDADIVVIGEGESTLVSLCNALQNSKTLENIPGIAYKEDNNIVLNAPSNFINDLDLLPVPDYSYATSFIERSKMGFLITSRGCPVRCIFCATSSFWGQKIRMHSVKRVVDDMEMLINQFKVKKIFFHDDTFNLSIGRVKAISKEIIDRGVKVEWGCSCRVTPVSEEMVSAMVSAGCRHICWGIESGSESMLRRINKNISLTQIRNAFEISKKFAQVMSTGAFTMVGNPGETEETINDTRKFLNTVPLTDSPSTSILYVLPGTVLYENLRKKVLINDSDWVKHDSVPLFTVDNSYRILYKWRNIVKNSGNRIPFKPEKHFWYSVITTSDLNRYVNKISKIKMIVKILIYPSVFFRYAWHIKKIISRAKLYLLNSKEQLSW